ncbi:MAG: excinuclease ABC subunit UvrB [Coprobacillus sp.]|nr:excinuclease ABC subunit UvrB [Coprobacillus sp.]
MKNSQEFQIVSSYKPTGDQPQAIEKIYHGLKEGKPLQVLLGATGTGKTFTMANIIEKWQKPTLILVHNKTLASQLYGEFKELFPNNRVEYFVSNFDYYQPEAYIPKTDTYIDKSVVMNDEIEMLRTSAINSVLERRDTIVIASVASIYGLTDPDEYRNLVFEVRVGEEINRKQFFAHLVQAMYKRNDIDPAPGTFRVRGDIIEVVPMDSATNSIIRIDTFGDEVERILEVNNLTGEIKHSYQTYPIYPAYDHASSRERTVKACDKIKAELEERIQYFKDNDKPLEAERIELRTRQDIDSLLEFGICPGIENYSRHLDGRNEGERPFCLFDYFPKDFLLIIDESHQTIPQIRGMYFGDRSRKETLVQYGFRLPSALDNRPLNFEEFESLMPQTICMSATPGQYELERVNHEVVEQIIRPTGLLDPEIEVRPTRGQIEDVIQEINKRVAANERVIIVTLTINMSEDLTSYLKERGIKVMYLHHEIKTLERGEIVYQLRKGKYDVLLGINLLREGLDIPEASLMIILDADKEGLFRNPTSLIQVIGRVARNVHGKVIMYADEMTSSMKYAIDETMRRRRIQDKYNQDNGIIPTSIEKPINPPIHNSDDEISETIKLTKNGDKKLIRERIKDLNAQMKSAADALDFERAATLRDVIIELQESLHE